MTIAMLGANWLESIEKTTDVFRVSLLELVEEMRAALQPNWTWLNGI